MNQELMAQLQNDLVVESLEGLDRFNEDLLALEKSSEGPAARETMRNAFRSMHTIKGSCGCLGLNKIEHLAHVGENLLSLLRDGKMSVTTEVVSSLLRCSDALREMMHELERTGSAGTADYSDLVSLLKALQDEDKPAAVPEAFGFFDDAPGAPLTVEEAPAELVVLSSGSEMVASEPAPHESEHLLASQTAIRVDVGQIDRMMNLVGELVLARNQIVQYAAQKGDSVLAASVQRVNLITTELQESVMKTRMQPIGNVWAKFPRIVRDVAQDLSKRVALTMEGAETELDRTIIEAIKDPLTHILRNSIDHGIELPGVRAAAGKPEEGTLSLRAFHEGGQPSDHRSVGRWDGNSHRDKILRKAMQRGLISEEHAARMGDREILDLIFLAGFSTAERVTNISGRGVGMDVVRTNIEKIGGSVDLQSETGKSTTLRIKIPLTLAIIPALIIASGGDRYAIPQASLVELVRIEASQTRSAIEFVDRSPVFRLRGNLLPLVYLHQTLETGATEQDEDLFIVVLQAEGRQFGLVVDRVHDTEEIVVKPLGKLLKSLSVYAGATIMGDGRVALILDVFGIARREGILEEKKAKAAELAEGAHSEGSHSAKETLLLARVGDNRMAVRLERVTRLEEIEPSSVERAGAQEVIQYRGRIMPLVRAGHVLGFAARGGDSHEALRVVVCSFGGRNVGLGCRLHRRCCRRRKPSPLSLVLPRREFWAQQWFPEE